MTSCGEKLMAQQRDSSLPVDFMSPRPLWKMKRKKIKNKAKRNWSSKMNRERILTHMKYQICTEVCCTLWEYSWARRENSILERISIFVIMLSCWEPDCKPNLAGGLDQDAHGDQNDSVVLWIGSSWKGKKQFVLILPADHKLEALTNSYPYPAKLYL